MNLHTSLPEFDLVHTSLAYLVGIKGVGMTALALLLQEAGVEVRGADVTESFVTDRQLQKRNIPVQSFEEAQIPAEATVVVYSGAHQGSQQRLVQEAKKRGLVCMNLAQAVGLLSRAKTTVGVCGVGGKSTTSALLSWMLETAGKKPSYAVGVGDIPSLGAPAAWNLESELFVVEADEYVADPTTDLTPRFLYLSPAHLICTSLSYDHPDVYKDFSDTEAAFRAFFAKLPEGATLVVNGDQEELCRLAGEFSSRLQVITVGEQENNQVQIRELRVENGVGHAVVHGSQESFSLESQQPGFHNLKNLIYAAVMARSLGIDIHTIQAAGASFRSTKRRFELIGVTKAGLRCYDDYAHHPREIQAIAATLQQWFPNQDITVAFQPHTYSRTKMLFAEFVAALGEIPGTVLLLPIFASAREKEDKTVSSEQLVETLKAAGKKAEYLPNQAALLQYIQEKALSQSEKPGVFITLGAGDIYTLYEQLAF